MSTHISVPPQLLLERILTLELVRVTERAAVSAARLRGHGNEKAADQAAVDAMPVPVILITYATTEDAVHKALAAVGRDKVISGKPQVIRIEKT